MQKFIHSSSNGAFTYCYLASEVDAVLKRQAAAAIAGMNAATAISRGQVQQANQLRAESSPEMLESERQANAVLTARVAELEKALEPFAKAIRGAEHMREMATAIRNNPVDGASAYVWWAAQSLAIDHFKQASNALMER